METYTHHVQYYETDKMGITHHSNYIRWMEEARADWMDKQGYGYSRLESIGIMSPVVNIECKFVSPTTFDDFVQIRINMAEYTGVRLVVQYEMYKGETLVFTGRSTHCFFNKDYRPIRLGTFCPELDQIFKKSVQ